VVDLYAGVDDGDRYSIALTDSVRSGNVKRLEMPLPVAIGVGQSGWCDGQDGSHAGNRGHRTPKRE
jgi:hypothetical protein